MRSSFSLLELIIAVFISSIIIIYSANFIKELHFLNYNKQEIQIQKLELLSTKLFLEKKQNIQNRVSLKNNKLYFDNGLLLKNVSSFTIQSNNSIVTISIEVNENISQTWSIKVE